jgi:hypothetical protein
MKTGIDKDYKLIPMSEITDEAREIAKRWYAGVSQLKDIREQHKLASDLMNYARSEIEKSNLLFEASSEILHLHLCEQEGLSSGMPTREQWIEAVNKLSEAINKYKP